MPVAIQMLEFKSQAEMSHVPQPQEALQFGWDPGSPGASEQQGAANAVSNLDKLTVTIHHTNYVFAAGEPIQFFGLIQTYHPFVFVFFV